MDQKKGQLRQTALRRGMGILLAAVMAFNTLLAGGFSAVASETVSSEEDVKTGLCQHHLGHTADCGYGEESPCAYKCPLCPIEKLIAALPGEVTEDNAAQLRTQLNEILLRYHKLTEAEQKLLDMSRCLKLQEQLNGMAAAESENTGDDAIGTDIDTEQTQSADPEESAGADAVEPESADPEGPESVAAEKSESADAVEPESAEPEEPESADTVEPESADPEEPESADPEGSEGADAVEPESADPEESEGAATEESEGAAAEESESADPEEPESADPEGTESVDPEGTESADPEEPESAEPEGSVLCAHHPAHNDSCGYGEDSPCAYGCRLCPIEGLIAALPDEATEDNAEQLNIQLEEILTLYSQLTEEEQEQLDMTRCLELQVQLSGISPSTLAMDPVPYMIGGTENFCDTYTVLTADTATWNTGWYVVNESVTIGSRVTVSGNVNLILADGCELEASQGINLSSGNSLTVYAQSGGTGKLTATATNSEHAGIGGSYNGSGGTVIINGGTVNATGNFGAGIGGGFEGSGGSVTVYGGKVTATSRWGAGIGGGYKGSGGTVTINGGTVNATGVYGAGIGGGYEGSVGTVIINGGTVTATSKYATGIGPGYNGSGGAATVTGGAVTAQGRNGAIGGDSAIIGGTFNDSKYYAITFDTGKEDVSVPKQGVKEGSKAAEPTVMEEGWKVSWYTDEACTEPFDFENTEVTENITLYAKWEVSTDYIAEVTIDGEKNQYTTLAGAWASLKDQTGTIKLLQNVTTTATLTVGSGMNVTVTMAEGVSFTNNSNDCFQVMGGTLTLAGGTVIENGSSQSVVYAASGRLYVSGGSYTSSKGNVLYVNKDVEVRLSGGSFTASGKALRYQNHTVQKMLAEGVDLFDANGKIVTKLDGDALEGGPYRVGICVHEEGYVSNGDGTHSLACTKCGYTAEGTQKEAHSYENGGCSVYENGECSVCGAKAAALVTVGGDSAFYEDLASAWASLKDQIGGTICFLQDVTDTTLTVGSGMNVTVTMEDGVSFTNTGADCFKVDGGTLTLAGGTVIENGSRQSVVYAASGVLNVTGGTYISSGNGLWIDSGVTVALSGGSFTAAGTALRYQNRKVQEMLAKGCAIYDINNQEVSLGYEKLESNGKTYWVSSCAHRSWSYTTNGNNTHTATCNACGEVIQEAHSYENGECSACGAVAAAQVTVGGDSAFYEDLASAWDSLENKTGTIKLLKDVNTTTTLTVSSGTDVTVTMAEGVTFANNSGDCFKVDGGTLTLAGGKVVGALNKNIVFATSGAVHVTGGSYESSGHGLVIASGATATLSGGSFTVSGTVLLYANHTVKDMLAEDCFLFDSDNQIISCDQAANLVHEGTFTVAKCLHPVLEYEVIDLDNHKGTCTICNREITSAHSWEDGSCTECGAKAVAQVDWGNGYISSYLSIEDAWNAAKWQTATITLLENAAVSGTLKVTGGSNITLKMAEGVSLSKALDSEDDRELIYIEGGSLTLVSGTVQNNRAAGVALWAWEGNLTISGGRVIAKGESGIGISVHNNSNLTISGGSVEAKDRALQMTSFGELKISGGSITSEGTALRIISTKATITGGTFSGGEVTLEKEWYEVDPEPSLLLEGYGLKLESGWMTDGYGGSQNLTGPISVKQIPFTMDTEDVEEQWYYGTEKILTAQVDLKISDIMPSYVWKNGEEILDCTQSEYTVSAKTEVGSYTYICEVTYDGYTLSKKFSVEILKSGTEIESLTVKNGQEETDTFFVDETVTVIARPRATEPALTMERRMRSGDAPPTAGQMALYIGESQVSPAVDAGEDGTYTMTVSAAYAAEVAGGLGSVTLTARFVGSDNMDAADAQAEITVMAAAQAECDGEVLAYYGASNLAQAFAAENSGATVRLLANVKTVEGLTVGEGSNITFDGGAFTLSNTNGNTWAFQVASGGTLNIIGGTVSAAGTGVRVSGGELNIIGGTVTAEYANGVGVADGGTVTITGGTVTGNHYGVLAQGGSTVTITGGTVTAEYGNGVHAYGSTVTITGGTVTAEYAYGVGVTDGGTVTITGGTFTGHWGVYAKEGSTVKISGGTVTGAYDGVLAQDGTTVTITDGTVTAENGSGVFAYGNTVTISGGEITAQGEGVRVGGSELNISGGTVTGAYYGVLAQDGSTVTITDGTVTAENGSGVLAYDSTVTISGGEITAKEVGIASVGDSTATISGGTITAKQIGAGVVMGGTLNMTDGTITAEEIGVYVFGSSTVKMSGGTFTGNVQGAIFAGENEEEGEEAGRIGDMLPNYGQATGPYYALYKEGQAVAAEAYIVASLPAGTYTVKECSHTDTVRYEQVSDETHNKKCTDCYFGGNAISESHHFVLSVEKNGESIALTQKCSECGYEYSGEVRFQIPKLVYGETLDQTIPWEGQNLEKFTMLRLGLDEYQLLELPENPLPVSELTGGKQLTAGQYTLKIVEIVEGEENRVRCSISLSVEKAELSVTAVDQSITYGEQFKQGTDGVTVDGICSGDSLGSVVLTASTEAVPGGTITPSAAAIKNASGEDVTGNYQISYVSGKLTIGKAEQAAPAAPTAESITDGSITLTAIAGAEYRLGESGEWTDSPVFEGLSRNTSYTFYVRLKGDSNHSPSPASEAIITTKKTVLDQATVTVSGNFAYTGAAQTPTAEQVTVKLGDTVIPSAEYTVSASDNVNAGTATVTVSAATDGSFSGSASGKFTIAKAEMTVTAVDQSITYGEQLKQGTDGVSAVGLCSGDSLGSVVLTASTEAVPGGTITPSAAAIKNASGEDVTGNYQISYVNGTLTVGKAEQAAPAAPTAESITDGSITLTAIAGAEYRLGESGEWTDSPVFEGLSRNTSYTFYARLKGDDNHSPSSASEATITTKKTALDQATVTVSGSFAYTGAAQTPTAEQVTVKLGDTVIPSAEYTVSASDNVNAGTATVTVSASGNYSGSASGKFTIEKAELTVTAADQSITYGEQFKQGTDGVSAAGLCSGDSLGSVVLTASTEAVPGGTITPSAAAIKNASGEDVTGNYQISYVNGTLTVGKAEQAAPAAPTAESITDGSITLTAIAGAEYRLGESGEWTDSPVFEGLSRNTSYTFYARLKGDDNHSPSSASKATITTKKAALSGAIVTVSGSFAYTGAAQIPTAEQVTVKLGDTVIPSTEYTVSASDNVNAGTATVTVSASGNYSGSASGKFTIAKAELTVTAVDQSITYGEQFKQGTDGVSAAGLCSGDSLGSVVLTASTEAVPGGTITPSAAAIKNASGEDVTGNYQISYVSGKLTVSKAEGTLTLPETSIRKTFGDGEFNLNCSTNGDGEISYVSSNENVASVSADGNVLIKGAGEVTITVSLAADENHTGGASREITVSVAKAAAPERVEETIEYPYSVGSDGAVTVDVTGRLPKDRGETKYTAVISKDEKGILADVSVDGDGNLSYTVPGNHAAGDIASITVTAQMANYESATYTVNIELVKKKVVEPLAGSSVSITDSNILTYGQTLSELTLDATIFVEKGTYNEVKGTLAWKAPSNVPAVNARVAEWVFTPEDKDEYAVLTGTVAITVVKATPKVEMPTAAGVTYDPSLTLDSVELKVGSATWTVGGSPVTVKGTWRWKDATAVPTVGASGYSVAFTPEDTANYNTVVYTVAVPVTQAVPFIAAAPRAAQITYGDALDVSVLTGGTVQHSSLNNTGVAGSFAWKDGSIKPIAADSGSTRFTVVFTPADTTNYTDVECSVTLTVEKAENAPNMPSAAMNVAKRCEKLSDVKLPDGWQWDEADRNTSLETGVPVAATAVYVGADQENYKNVTVTVTVTRAECDHDHTELRNVVASTCQKKGYSGDRYCLDCGELVEQGTQTDLAEHSGGTATCIRGKICEVCKAEYTGKNSANHRHTEIRGAVKATCGADGHTGYTYCTDCHAKISSGKVLPAKGHNWHTVSENAPSIKAEGRRIYVCFRCGQNREEIIPKLPQSSHTHRYREKETKAATCTEGGVITYSCGCGDSYVKNTEALGHSYKSEVTKLSTTTETGELTYTCTGCGSTYMQPIPKIPQLSHTHRYSEKETKAATCTERGEISYSCSCGNSYTRGTAALGHSYEGEVTKPASTTEAGVRTFTCTLCGDSYSEPIDRLEETPTETQTEAPTEAPTEVPTEAPTEVPTEAPTEVPTEAPTAASAETQESGDSDLSTRTGRPYWPWWILLVILLIILFLVARRKKEEKSNVQ